MRIFSKAFCLNFFALMILASIQLHGGADNKPNMTKNKTMDENVASKKNIVQIAQENKDFGTLVKALVAANLVTALEGQGPFTVFAPTNQAFDKLPAGTLQDLLKPENKEKLAAILTYHVVPGKVLAADVKTMDAKTLNGKDLKIKVNGSAVTVNGAKVLKTDIIGSNGVIHVIDSVLLP